MTHFMYCTSHALQPIVRAISCGDTHIGGMTTAGEGMDGDIQTTFVEIKSYEIIREGEGDGELHNDALSKESEGLLPIAVATSEHISFCFSTVNALCPSNGFGTT